VKGVVPDPIVLQEMLDEFQYAIQEAEKVPFNRQLHRYSETILWKTAINHTKYAKDSSSARWALPV
jgi:hypothetical protein